MGILELITNMRNQGISEKEISDSLREQGVSPKEIRDALNQSQIKNAISQQGDFVENDLEAPRKTSPNYPLTQSAENYYTPAPKYSYAPQPSDYPQAQDYSYTQQPSEQEAYPQNYYPQEDYSGGSQEEYAPSEGVSTDTLIEISEQVFSEKIKKIQTQIEAITEFKVLAETKIDSFSDRLKRIEEVIDKLQAAILEKVGSYGRNLESIKKEMSMMQDSFSKVINPVLDKTQRPSETHFHHRGLKKK